MRKFKEFLEEALDKVLTDSKSVPIGSLDKNDVITYKQNGRHPKMLIKSKGKRIVVVDMQTKKEESVPYDTPVFKVSNETAQILKTNK